MEKEKASAKAALEVSDAEIKRLMESLKGSEVTVRGLEEEVSRAGKTLKANEVEMKGLRTGIFPVAALRGELTLSRTEVTHLGLELEGSRGGLRNLEGEIQAVRRDLAEREGRLATRHTKIANLCRSLTETKRREQDTIALVDRLRDEITSLKSVDAARVATAISRQTMHQAKIRHLSSRHQAELRHQAGKHSLDMSSANSDLEMKLLASNKVLIAMTANKRQVQAKVNELTDSLEALELERDEWQEARDGLRGRHQEASRAGRRAGRRLEGKLITAAFNIGQLENEYSALQQENSRLHSEIELLRPVTGRRKSIKNW